MEPSPASSRRRVDLRALLASPLPGSSADAAGRWLLQLGTTVRQLGAFALITLSVLVTKLRASRSVVQPLIATQVARAGVRMLPMVIFLAGALGFVVIGQTVALLTRVGVQNLVGTVMVTVVVRELGPLVTAMVVLMRVGSATVVELATARALGEVEALEALGIDPIHYMVVPRVIGLAIAVLALTVYFILATLASGYLFAFLQDVPLKPDVYFRQVALALGWGDFLLLALKAMAFGVVIAVVTCYEGLAQPLELAEVSTACTRALVRSLIVCVCLDAFFIVIYLLM